MHVRQPEPFLSMRSGDPLEAIVAELARIERGKDRLKQEDVRADLEDNTEGLGADELDRQMDEKRDALRSLASHFQAATRDGAILQAMIALYVELDALDDDLPDGFYLDRPESAGFRATRARLARLLYSVAYADDSIGEDLRLLRERMAPRGFDGIAELEKLAVR
jgi:hypothetical protein